MDAARRFSSARSSRTVAGDSARLGPLVGVERPGSDGPLLTAFEDALQRAGHGARATYLALRTFGDDNPHGAVWPHRATVVERRCELGLGEVAVGTLTNHYAALAAAKLIARRWRIWRGHDGLRKRLYVVFLLAWSPAIGGFVGQSAATCALFAWGADRLRYELRNGAFAGLHRPRLQVCAAGSRTSSPIALEDLYPVARARPEDGLAQRSERALSIHLGATRGPTGRNHQSTTTAPVYQSTVPTTVEPNGHLRSAPGGTGCFEAGKERGDTGASVGDANLARHGGPPTPDSGASSDSSSRRGA